MQNLMIICLVSLFLAAPINAVVKNDDKPAKGRWDFGLKEMWSVDGAGTNPLVAVQNIQVDDKGNVFFMDRKFRKIAAFDSNGKDLVYFGKTGEGPGEVRRMVQFFLQGPNIIVEDRGGRLHYFSKKGEYAKTVRYNSRSEIKGFIGDSRFVSILSNFGTKAEKENENLEIYDIEEKNSTVIASLKPEEIVRVAKGSGKDRMEFEAHINELTPAVIVCTSGSSIFFGKNDRYFIKKTDFSGKELFSFSLEGRPAKTVSKKDKEGLFGGGLPPDIIQGLVKGLPDQCTFFTKIHVDEKGFIYVYTPDLSKPNDQDMDIFSPSGQYLYRSAITLPGGITPAAAPVFAGEHLYVFAEDEEGERKLVKYKINTIK
jgi:hypothetical protein